MSFRVGDWARCFTAAACALNTTHSQWNEDLLILPTLLSARPDPWSPGVFVELGAFDGVQLSNTIMLERCFGWTGVLIEANPLNFAKLNASSRKPAKLHSAVCAQGAQSVEFTAKGGAVAAQAGAAPAAHTKLWAHRHGKRKRLVNVPCRPLASLMAHAGYSKADFLSVDVEGAEEIVLTSSPGVIAKCQMVMVEMDRNDRDKDERVHQLLEAAGLKRARRLYALESGIYLKAVISEVPVLEDIEGNDRTRSTHEWWRMERKAYLQSPGRNATPQVRQAVTHFFDAYLGALDFSKKKGWRPRIALVWAFVKSLFAVLQPSMNTREDLEPAVKPALALLAESSALDAAASEKAVARIRNLTQAAQCSWQSVVYAAATLGPGGKDDRTEFLQGYQRTLPGVRILQGVNGFNHTEALVKLLDSRIPFYNLSSGGRYWGHLANMLTHYYMLMHQVEHSIPYQVTMEDDLIVQQPYFSQYINGACASYKRKPWMHILQLSQYSELLMTSLEGATVITTRMRQVGIRKNVDQELLDHRVLGHSVGRHLNQYKFSKPMERPVRLGRRTNKGDISSSRMITWAEMALLRMITGVSVRELPYLGNPPDTDDCARTKCHNRAQKRRVARR